MRASESDSYLIPAIDLQPVTGTFFHVLFFLCGAIQGETLQCSSHLYFQMLPLTSQPNSFSPPPPPPPLPRATLLTPCTPRTPSLGGIWSFVFPIKGEIYSAHSYFLYLDPPLPSFTNERGGCGARRLRRLSRDHLAHLIKHRGFNLAPRVCRRLPPAAPSPRKQHLHHRRWRAQLTAGRGREEKNTLDACRCARQDARRPGDCSLVTQSSGGKSVCRLQWCHLLFFIFKIYLFVRNISFPRRVCFDAASFVSPSRQRGATHGESPPAAAITRRALGAICGFVVHGCPTTGLPTVWFSSWFVCFFLLCPFRTCTTLEKKTKSADQLIFGATFTSSFFFLFLSNCFKWPWTERVQRVGLRPCLASERGRLGGGGEKKKEGKKKEAKKPHFIFACSSCRRFAGGLEVKKGEHYHPLR